ncbi:CHAT domain-containing protein [Actinoplanes sp. NPDC051861]|uniref:CHAT domain-containing tetratricopeptide repeat protein n=1 Tax=Actinoplanes sp. NPDC051861 TaxID=3155170 RepID=UPI003425FD36
MSDPLEQLSNAYEAVRRLQDQGHNEQAFALAWQMLEPSRRLLGPDHPENAELHSTIGILARRTGRYELAVQQQREGLAIRLRHFGERDPSVAISLSNLGTAELDAGDTESAERNLRRALDLRRADPATDPVTIAFSRSNLASALVGQRRIAEAEEQLRWAAAEIDAAGDTDDWRAVMTLGNLAQLLRETNRYGEALPVLGRIVDLAERILPADHYLLAEQRAALSLCLFQVGQNDEASALHASVAEQYRQQFGPADKRTVAAYLNWAAGAYSIGELGEAEAAARQALDGAVTGSFEQGYAYQLLGNIHRQMHRRTQAQDESERAVAILEKAHPASVHLGRALSDLGALLREKRRYVVAASLFERAIAILRPADDDALPAALNNYGVLKLETDDLAEAERLWRECFALYATRPYPQSQRLMPNVTNNLGELLRDQGRYAEAEPLLRDALDRHRSNRSLTTTNLYNVAHLCATTNRPREALDLMLEAAAEQDRMLQQVFGASSAAQRREHTDSLLHGYESTVSLAVGLPGAAADAYGLVLRRKGLLAEGLLAQYRAATTGAAREVREELFRVSAETAAAVFHGNDTDRTAAAQRREMLEERLAQETKGGALPDVRTVTTGAVAAALPVSTSLVEYARFTARNFGISPWRREAWGEDRYAVFVLTGDGRVEMVDLGPADPLDALAAEFREVLGRGGEGMYGYESGAADPDELARVGARLRAAVLDPVVRALPPAQSSLLIAPDSGLTKIPFAALPGFATPNLLDEYEIGYLTTGRKLLDRIDRADRLPAGPALVLADPDFGPGDFVALPQSRIEGQVVAGLLGVPPRLGASATGSALLGARGPRIVHLATHAYFVPEEKLALKPVAGGWSYQVTGEEEGVSWFFSGVEDGQPWSISGVIRPGPLGRLAGDDDLHRSGLAFAGANAWLAGDPGATPEAVLTADRLSVLDLRATEMVVLSACETGLGVTRSAEGVLGLRWACAAAGARSLLISLWKVPDAETREFMEQFYRLLLGGMSRSAALRATQIEQRRRHTDPYFWAAFVLEGETGPLRTRTGGPF